MILSTERFGTLEVSGDLEIHFPQGLVGLPSLKRFCVVDPGDDTLILWLQSMDEVGLAFPMLEPKIFENKYSFEIQEFDLETLELKNLKEACVLSIITIPERIREMTANLKAPLVINPKSRIGMQLVLNDADKAIKHPMFLPFKTHLMTIKNQRSEPVGPQVLEPSRLPLEAGI